MIQVCDDRNRQVETHTVPYLDRETFIMIASPRFYINAQIPWHFRRDSETLKSKGSFSFSLKFCSSSDFSVIKHYDLLVSQWMQKLSWDYTNCNAYYFASLIHSHEQWVKRRIVRAIYLDLNPTKEAQKWVKVLYSGLLKVRPQRMLQIVFD